MGGVVELSLQMFQVHLQHLLQHTHTNTHTHTHTEFTQLSTLTWVGWLSSACSRCSRCTFSISSSNTHRHTHTQSTLTLTHRVHSHSHTHRVHSHSLTHRVHSHSHTHRVHSHSQTHTHTQSSHDYLPWTGWGGWTQPADVPGAPSASPPPTHTHTHTHSTLTHYTVHTTIYLELGGVVKLSLQMFQVHLQHLLLQHTYTHTQFTWLSTLNWVGWLSSACRCSRCTFSISSSTCTV